MRALKITFACLLVLLVAPIAAYAQTSGNPMSPLAGVTCNGSSCKGVPNDSTHWFYGFDPTVNTSVQQLLTALGQPLTINTAGLATSTLQTAGNASLVTIAAASGLQATAANQATGNGSLATIATASASQATAAKQDAAQTSLTAIATAQGTQGTGSTFNPPTGGSGIIGYLSGIYKAITGTLTVSGSVTTTPASGTGPVPYGSTGLDFSANKPTLPNIGANFAASGPYASYVLIATVPTSATRANVDIENLSGAQIAIIRDDGTAANAAAPVNASVFSLAPGAAAGQQGGSWMSATFKGRLQIYALSSAAQVAVMVE